MGNSSQVEVCGQMKNRVLLTHHIADDEKLHIWDVDKKQAYQVISDDLGRWGQVTCAKWLPGVSDSGNFLCFGTGRGLVLIYHQAKQAVRLLYFLLRRKNILTMDQGTFKELSNTAILPFNEPVEAMDYDRYKCRLVLSSHTGKIKLCQVEKNGTNHLPGVVITLTEDL